MFCLDPVIIVVLQDYFPDVEAARTFSAFQRRHHCVPSGTIFSRGAERRQRRCIPDDVGTDTTSPSIGLLSAVLVFSRPDFTWVCLAPSQPPPTRPTAAPLQNARRSETRGPRGILLLSNCCHQPWFCLHTAASLPLFWLSISATATFLFFLYDRLLVSTHRWNNFYIFILFVIFVVKSFCLFLKLPSTEPGSLTFHMNLHINITFSSP